MLDRMHWKVFFFLLLRVDWILTSLFKMNSRQEGYRYQPRLHKNDNDPTPPHYPLSKAPSYSSAWKPYEPAVTPSRSSVYDDEDDSRVSGILRQRREEERRRQESALKKVRELQDRVLPMVRGDRSGEQGVLPGWQARIEQRALRLEGQVENMRAQMQLILERRVAELENKWEERFAQQLQERQEQD